MKIKNFNLFKPEINESKINERELIEILEDSGLFDDYNGNSYITENKIFLCGWICSEVGRGIRKRIIIDNQLYSSLFIDGDLSSDTWEYKSELPHSMYNKIEKQHFYNLDGMIKVQPEVTKKFVDKIDLIIETIKESLKIECELEDVILFKRETTFEIYLNIKK